MNGFPDDASSLDRLIRALEDGRIDAARRLAEKLLDGDGAGGAIGSRGPVLLLAAEAALFANDTRAAAQHLDEAVGFPLTEADLDRIEALHATLTRHAEDPEFRRSFWEVVVYSARAAEPAYRARVLADAGGETGEPAYFEGLLELASGFESQRRGGSWLLWMDWASHVTHALMNLGRLGEAVAMQRQILKTLERENPGDAGMAASARTLLSGLESMQRLSTPPV